jgi:hypothetical protein
MTILFTVHIDDCLKDIFSSLSKKEKYWYLGVTFDRKLVWNEHINNVANKTLARISVLQLLLSAALKLLTVQQSLGLHTQIKATKTPDA